MKLRYLLAGAPALALCSLPASAQVQVSSTGLSYATIQAAIDNSSPGDTLTIQDPPAGQTATYSENLLILGARAPLTLRTASGEYPPRVIVDGQLNGSVLRFTPNGSPIGNDTLIEGIILENGSGTLEPASGKIVGGAVACFDGASPTIRNCILRSSGAQRGGGVYIGQTVGTQGARLMRNVIRNNNATEDGGGVYVEVVQGELGLAPQFSRSRISDNTAGSSGGGLYASSGTNPAMDHCWFVNNTATGLDGGGVCLVQTISARIESSMLDGNHCGGGGGGLAAIDVMGTRVEHTTVVGNDAMFDGGGIYDMGADQFGLGPTRLVNDLITSNRSFAGRGGGLFSIGDDTELDFCTLSGNIAPQGGGISHAGVVVRYSILWADDQTQGGLPWEDEIHSTFGSVPTVLHSDVKGSASAPWFGATNLDTNPGFTLGEGCPHASVKTFHLVQNSNPCVNKVTPQPAEFPTSRCTNPVHAFPDTGAADIGFHYPGVGCP